MNAYDLVSKTLHESATFSWPGSSSMKQCFSLPSTIVYYMAKNPSSSKVYSKTSQSCKYFFETTPILVAAYITAETSKNVRICPNEKCDFDYNWKGECCSKFDVIKATKNIWLTHGLSVSYTSRAFEFYQSILAKFYRYEFFQLYLKDLTIKYDDFKSMVSSVKVIYLHGVTITYNIDDQNFVPLEDIIEAIPNIEDFYYGFNYNTPLTVNNTTIKNISKLENLTKLKSFNLLEIPEGFNVKDLTNFINNLKNIIFWLQFRQDISKQYENQLDKLVAKVVKSKFLNRHITYGPYGSNNHYATLRKRYVASYSAFNCGYLRAGTLASTPLFPSFGISKGWKRIKNVFTKKALS